MNNRILIQALTTLATLILSNCVHANNIITFEGLTRGLIIDDEYEISHGITINGYNSDQNADNMAVIFDTDADNTLDPDLEAPFTDANGNILNPGNVLIIHERPNECDGVSCGNNPDDEGSRPAGYFDIAFDQEVTLNSIDFFDIEYGENGDSWRNRITVGGSGSYSAFHTPFTGGDNTWGRLDFNLTGVTSVRIKLHGSGAIDNIDYSIDVPAPPVLLIFSLGLMALIFRRRQPSDSAAVYC